MKKSLFFTAAIMLFSFIGFSNPINDSVTMGPSYANDVFYSLSTGVVKTEARNNWDIAFYTNRWSAGITINDGVGVMLYTYPKGDTSSWSAIDTSGMTSWTNTYNSDTIWEDGAFNRNALGHPDYGWGVYNMVSHDVIGDSLYILKLASGQLKKMWIQKKNSVSNTFYFKYANIDGSELQTEVLNATPYESKLFVYYSITNKAVVDREPEKTTWDLLFSKYAGIVFDNTGAPTNYLVVGIVSNVDVTVSKNMPVTPDFEDWFLTTFEDHKSPIGHNWKSFNMNLFQWVIEDSLTYFVTSKQGDIHKLIINSFSGSGSGKTFFTKKLLSLVSIDEKPNSISELSVYPNPAVNTLTIQFNEIENQNAEVRLFDQRGRLAIQEVVSLVDGKKTIDINQLENGLYIVETTMNGTKNRQKIIVQH